MTETRSCKTHSLTWPCGEGGYTDCPRCVPQPRCWAELKEDRNHWPGAEYYWDHGAGCRGEWREMGHAALIPMAEFDLLREVMGNWNGYLIEAAAKEILRLRGADPAAPICTSKLGPKRLTFSELADKCQELETALQRKRAECDELRDKLRRL